MRKKHSLLIVIPVSITILLIALYFFEKEGVEVAEVSINLTEKPCHVDFVLINKLNYYVSCKVSIRGFRRLPGRHTPGAVQPGFTGEKILNVELYPGEKKALKEVLKLSGPTYRIKVHAFNVKILQ